MKHLHKLITLVIMMLVIQSAKSQWTNVTPGFSSITNMRGMSAPSDQVIWIAGSDSTNSGNYFARSENGGLTWSSFSISGFSSFTPSNIHALNKDTAWVAMYDATGGGGIFRTNNGGNTWVRQTTATFAAPAGFPNFVHFFDANNGVCMGDPNGGYFEIYTTTNGGTNWNRISAPSVPINQLGEYGTTDHYSVSGNVIYFNTNKGRIFSSTNRGATWKVSSFMIGADSAYAYRMIAKPNSQEALCLIQSNTDASIYKLAKTTNAGTSWQIEDYMGFIGSKDGDYIQGNATGWYFSVEQNYYSLSYDGGKTWIQRDLNLNSINPVMASSPNGTIWLGGQYINAQNTGLLKFTVPQKDVTISSFQIGNGKTNCFAEDSFAVNLFNAGQSTAANLSYYFYRYNSLTNSWKMDTASQRINTGNIAAGQTRLIKWNNGRLMLGGSNNFINAVVSLQNASTLTFNDTVGFGYNATRSLSSADNLGNPIGKKIFLVDDSVYIRLTAQNITTIQWQSRAEDSSTWVNEPAVSQGKLLLGIKVTKNRWYRALVCGSLITDSILITVAKWNAIGFTYYDNQSNGSINNRIQFFNNKISAVFTGSMDSTNTATPDRGSFYNVNNGSGWNPAVTSRLESIRTGFPSMVVTSTGKEIIVSHSALSKKLTLLRRNTAGTGAWTELLDTIQGMWPRITSSGGDTLHLIALNNDNTVGAILRYYRSTNAGNTWDIAIDLPGYTTANGFALTAAETYAIQALGNTVCIVAGGYNNRLVLWKSTNRGTSWTTQTIKTFPAGWDGNTVYPRTETTDGSVSLVLDNQLNAHVFTGLMYLQDDVASDNTWSYFPGTDGLLYWREGFATDSLKTISSAAFSGNTSLNWHQTSNSGLCSFPSATIDRVTGNMYVTFNIPVDNTNTDGTSNRYDIFGIMSKDGGNFWSPPKNLTQTAASGLESSFPSSIVGNNKVQVLWQTGTTPTISNGVVNKKTIVHQAFAFKEFSGIDFRSISNNSICAGDSIDISYLAIGDFLSVQVQLSTQFNFATPISIASFANTNVPTIRRIKIPNTISGSYYIRMISNDQVISNNFMLINVNEAIVKPIIIQKRPIAFCDGDSTILELDSAQSAKNFFVWYINGIQRPDSALIKSIVVKNTAFVQVKAFNGLCEAWSDTVKVNKSNTTAIKASITPDTTLCEGSILTLKATVTAGTPTSFQWKKGAAVVGTNSPNLVIGSVNKSSSGKYIISISSQCPLYTSDTIDVVVLGTPAIIKQPLDVTACDGSNAIFSVGIDSNEVAFYQWMRGTNVVGNSPTITIFNVATTDTGLYRCNVSNICGTTTSRQAKLSITESIRFNSLLSDTSICKGNTLKLSANTSGTNIRYNWFRDSLMIDTNVMLMISNIDLKDSGEYSLMIANSCGTLISNKARVQIKNAPTVVISVLSSDTLYANVSGTFNTLQWWNDSIIIPNATDTLYAATKSGTYQVKVTSSNGCSNVSNKLQHNMTSVQSLFALQNIMVYPNPANEIVSIESPEITILNVTLFDMIGEQIISHTIDNKTAKLNVSNIPQGMYQLLINTHLGKKSVKIIIE
jgi:hypothetical protein